MPAEQNDSRNKMKNKTQKTAVFSLLLALSMILSYLESVVGLDFIAPGIKLGLANSVVLCLVIIGNKKWAFIINLCRIILSGLIFSGLSAIIYSLCGGICAFIIMLIAKKSKLFGTVGISILGAVAHNAAQLAVAVLIIQSKGLFYYLPILLICAVACGALTGIITSILQKNKQANKILALLNK